MTASSCTLPRESGDSVTLAFRSEHVSRASVPDWSSNVSTSLHCRARVSECSHEREINFTMEPREHELWELDEDEFYST